MKKIRFLAILTIGLLCLCFSFVACEPNNDNGNQNGGNITTEGNVLIAYFSRTGENYSVGVIDKGNTEIIAEIIAEQTGGELFEIQRITPYSDNYEEVKDEAEQEKRENARPELLESKNISDYDKIFIGYPIWHGDMPMPLYTFIEANDWTGKTVIPFCTHEGSGLSGTMSTIRTKCAGATVLDGLAVRGATAQNQQSQARQSVINWLNGLNY